MTDTERAELQATLDRLDAEYAEAWSTIIDRLATGEVSDPVRTGFGGALVIAATSLIDGALSVVLTEDGVPAVTHVWHNGDVTGDSVYVERWEGPSRRTFHGYVDPTSRRLVQTG